MDIIETSAVQGEQPAFEQLTVSLADCRFGRDFPDGPINPRVTDRGASPELVASVKESGVLEPLIGVARDGLYYFSAGDRRLDALFKAHCAARNEAGYPYKFETVRHIVVPIIIHHRGDPLEIGLQENLNRNNLHPVDRMEAFATLLSRGKSEADIAAAFSMRPAQVKQSLRLGVLSKPIREAWRAGTMDAATAEAFTLCRDEKQQLKILDRLQKKVGPGGRMTPHHVRQALKAQPGEVKRLLTFVTRAVYESGEGCFVTESLFGSLGSDELGEPMVSDVAALKEMAENKLADHAGVLRHLPKSEGGAWAWARPASAMPEGWQSWPRMLLDRKLSIKDRESVGCVVSIDGEGKLQVDEAIYWKEATDAGRGGSRDANPAAAPREEEGGNAAPTTTEIVDTALDAVGDVIVAAREAEIGDKQPGTSDVLTADLPPRLQQLLAEQLQAGLSKALSGRNDLALPVLLAAIASRGEVVAISTDSDRHVSLYPFEEALEQYAAMDLGGQLRSLASVVASALTLIIMPGQVPPAFMAGPQALLRAMESVMGSRALKKHLVEAFDVAGYVKAAPKAQLVMAIGECCGADQAKKIEGKGAEAVRKFAALHLAEQKWLPPELTGGIIAAPKAAVKRAAPKPVKARAATKAKAPARKAAIGKKGRR